MPEPSASNPIATRGVRQSPGGAMRAGSAAGADDRFAAVCEFLGSCAVVVVRIEPAQSFTTASIGDADALSPRALAGRRIGRCRIIAAQTFAPSDTAGIRSFLDSNQAQRLIRVLPNPACLARALAVPGLDPTAVADDAALAAALELASEAELPGVPAWRRSAGWTGPLRADQAQAGGGGAIVQAWPVSAEVAPILDDRNESFMSPPAAMLGLVMLNPAIAVLAAIERESGSVSVLVMGQDRTLARASRAPASSPEAWRDGASKVIQESARSAGSSEFALDASAFPDSGLLMWLWPTSDSGPAAQSAPSAPAMALCLGALAIAGSDRRSVQSLASLTRHEVLPAVPAWQRAARWLARPRHAAAIIAASLFLALGLPLASAYARQSVLRERADAIDLDRRLAEAEQRIGLYSLIRERRWPMTKLMGDIAGAAPVGIEFDTLDLNQGEPIIIRGRAERPDLVAQLRENLTKSRVFTQVTTPSVEADASGVKFQLVARIEGNRAIYPGERAEDFSKQTLAIRLYGDGATWQDSDLGRAEDDDGSDQSTSSSRNGNRSGRSSRDDEGSNSRAPSSPSSVRADVPPPALTEADYAAMDRTKAMLEWSSRKAAAARASDPEIKRRLTEESDRSRQRMLELQRGGGGGS